MRKLLNHKTNEANDQLEIKVLDEPGSGGANHHYLIEGGVAVPTFIHFQDGPIKEAGVNGITHEALLAILEDRLKSFQAGPYACIENEMALAGVQLVQYWLRQRTKNREARGVEGTHTV